MTVPAAPIRSLSQNDKAILQTTSWSAKSDLEFEDKVSVADSKAIFLTGLVMYVGSVHFEQGTWVGIQLIGPSLGKGNSDGTFKGKAYFAKVGSKNGVMAPIDQVNKYDGHSPLDPEKQRVIVDALTNSRVASILSEEKKNSKKLFHKEEVYIQRLKDTSLGDAIGKRNAEGASLMTKLKYSTPYSSLCESDFQLVTGLDKTHQNFCVSDPTMPDNPITYASQAFLDLTGYRLSEILGRNCRFLQGKATERVHVDRIRQSIIEGADCHVCLINYRKDGSTFHNRLFMTALRDSDGRVKNYLGVQCEVSESLAKEINEKELKLFNAGMERKGTKFTIRNKGNEKKDDSQSASSGGSNTTGETVDTKMPVDTYDMDEALFRSGLDDPFAPMTLELAELYEKLKEDPFAGYTTSMPLRCTKPK